MGFIALIVAIIMYYDLNNRVKHTALILEKAIEAIDEKFDEVSKVVNSNLRQ